MRVLVRLPNISPESRSRSAKSSAPDILDHCVDPNHHDHHHHINITVYWYCCVSPSPPPSVDCRSALIIAVLEIHTCGSAAGWRSQYPAISFSVELPLVQVDPETPGLPALWEKLDRSSSRTLLHSSPSRPAIIVLPVTGLSLASTRYHLVASSNNPDSIAPACAQRPPLTPNCSPLGSRSTTQSSLHPRSYYGITTSQAPSFLPALNVRRLIYTRLPRRLLCTYTTF